MNYEALGRLTAMQQERDRLLAELRAAAPLFAQLHQHCQSGQACLALADALEQADAVVPRLRGYLARLHTLHSDMQRLRENYTLT